MIAGLGPALYYGDAGYRSTSNDEPVDCPCIFCHEHCNETCEGEDIVENLTKQVINDGLDFAGVMFFLAMCGVALGVWV